MKLKTEKKSRINKKKCFEKINKIDKPLARMTKKKVRHKLPISAMKQGILLQACRQPKDKNGIL